MNADRADPEDSKSESDSDQEESQFSKRSYGYESFLSESKDDGKKQSGYSKSMKIASQSQNRASWADQEGMKIKNSPQAEEKWGKQRKNLSGHAVEQLDQSFILQPPDEDDDSNEEEKEVIFQKRRASELSPEKIGQMGENEPQMIIGTMFKAKYKEKEKNEALDLLS